MTELLRSLVRGTGAAVSGPPHIIRAHTDTAFTMAFYQLYEVTAVKPSLTPRSEGQSSVPCLLE